MSEWISVEDGLPEQGDAVLIFTDDFEFASIQSDEQWYRWGMAYEIDGWIAEGEVTHWMPLINPTVGRGDDENT